MEVRAGLDLVDRMFGDPPASDWISPATPASRAPRRPAVSVVIPTFNRAQVLPRTLQSVLAQSFGDLEVLVVDDGSSDRTEEVVAGWRDDRIRYMRQPENRGVGAARNRGLRESRADLIAFLDADDEWLPNKLACQIELFGRLPEETGLVYTGVESVHGDGTTSVQRPSVRGDAYRRLLWTNAIHGGGSNVMMRRGVVASAGFLREHLAAIEDHDYWLRIARFFTVDAVEEPLIRYHDAPAAGRRSNALQPNLEARWWFYRTHGEEMRRAGVAHLFLVGTARWALASPWAEARDIRRLAAQAVLEAPMSRMAAAMLIRSLLPAARHVAWVRRHAALE